MKISKEEYRKWYEGGALGRGFPWMEMNTDSAKQHTDEKLLGLIAQCPLVESAGFGLVAELCKRFNNEKT
ncbi:MAG: hypothetical protein OEX12_11515 [Gammaproteobacteria bacterium]|nr:hypothetical protein [Gammaproteobacteria bacterium]